MGSKDRIILIDSIIVFFIGIVLLVDSINGLFLRYHIFSIGQVYKIFLLLLIFMQLIKYCFLDALTVLFVSVLFLLSSFISFLSDGGGNITILSLDFSIVLKYMTILLSYFYFKMLFQKNTPINVNLILKIFVFSFVVIAFNMLLGVFGFGFAQYGEGSDNSIGTKGFFYAGNELTGVMFIVFSFLLYFFDKRGNVWIYIIVSLFFLFLSILKATKGAIFGTLLGIVIIPFLSYNYSFKRIKVALLKRILLFTGFLCVSLVVIYLGAKSTGLLDRIEYFMHNRSLITFLLSARDESFSNSYAQFLDKFNFFNYIFGKGTYTFTNSVINSAGAPTIVEIDFFDFLFQYGFVGVSIVYGIHIYWTCRAYLLRNNEDFPFARIVFFINSILLLISFTAGHIFNSGMVTVFIGMVNALIYCKANIYEKLY